MRLFCLVAVLLIAAPAWADEHEPPVPTDPPPVVAPCPPPCFAVAVMPCPPSTCCEPGCDPCCRPKRCGILRRLFRRCCH